MKTFEKYKQNLQYDDEYIYSFHTKVAKYDENFMYPLDWEVEYKNYEGESKLLSSSPTTTKHIYYSSIKLGKIIIK